MIKGGSDGEESVRPRVRTDCAESEKEKHSNKKKKKEEDEMCTVALATQTPRARTHGANKQLLIKGTAAKAPQTNHREMRNPKTESLHADLDADL